MVDQPRSADDERVAVHAGGAQPGIFNKPEGPQHDPQGWYGEGRSTSRPSTAWPPQRRSSAPNNRRDLDAAVNHVVNKQFSQSSTSTASRPSSCRPGLRQAAQRHVHPGGGGGYRRVLLVRRQRRRDGTVRLRHSRLAGCEPVGHDENSIGIGQTNNRVLETGWGTSTYRQHNHHRLHACRLALRLGRRRQHLPKAVRAGRAAGVSGRAILPTLPRLAIRNRTCPIGQTQTLPGRSGLRSSSERSRPLEPDLRRPHGVGGSRRRVIRTGSPTRSSMRTRPRSTT